MRPEQSTRNSWHEVKTAGHFLQQFGSPLTPLTKMRVASVSKPITAVAMLQLVEAGKLNLDSTVLSPRSRLCLTDSKNVIREHTS